MKRLGLKYQMRFIVRCAMFLALVLLAVIVPYEWRSTVTSWQPESESQQATAQGPIAPPKEASPARRKLLDDFDNRLNSGTEWTIIFYFGGVFYMFLALAITCDEYFVPALEIICAQNNIKDDVAGATFMAAGGSAPELFTALVATFKESAVGFGTVVGSAVFNVLFVIAMCALFAKEELQLTWWPLARDSIYYTISLLVLATFFGWTTPNEILWWEALILFLMYGGYVLLMYFNEALHKWFVVTLGGGEEAWKAIETEKRIVKKRGRDVFFRVGVLSLLQGTMHDLAGLAVVTQMQGTDAYETFNSIDKRDGVINSDDLKRLFEALDLELEEDEVQAAREELDENGDGVISFEEFEIWYSRSEAKLKNEMNQIFDTMLDSDEAKIHGGEEMASDNDAPALPSAAAAELPDARVCAPLPFLSGWSCTPQDSQTEPGKAAHSDQNNQERNKIKKKLIFEHMIMESAAIRQSEGFEDRNARITLRAAMLTLTTDRQGYVYRDDFCNWYKENIFQAGQEEEEEDDEEVGDTDSLVYPSEQGCQAKTLYVLVSPVAYLLWMTIPDCKKTGELCAGFTYEGLGCWIAFITSIAWIGGFSYFMVEWAEIIGHTCHIPDEVMGLTILAAGTSVPDLLSSVIVAQQGRGDMAVSSSIGSNIFDVLVGLPVPWLLYTAIKQETVTINADSFKESLLVLIAMLMVVVLVIKLCGWVMTRTMGYVMLALYVVFVMQDLLRADDFICDNGCF